MQLLTCFEDLFSVLQVGSAPLPGCIFQALTQPAQSVNSMKSACMGQWSRGRVSRVVMFQTELAAALPNMPFPLAPFT